MSIDFLVTSLIVVASPGTGVLYTLAVLTWMRRAFAGAFVALGAKLALADRR